MTTTVVNERLSFGLYDSIKEIPASLHQKARQYECMSSELGSSEVDRDRQLAQLSLLVAVDQKAEAANALYNYRLARSLTLDCYQPGQLEWACFLHSVNGEAVKDYSEGALTTLINQLSLLGLTQSHIEVSRGEAKRRIESEVKRYFPKRLHKARGYNELERYKTYLYLKAQYMLNPTDDAEKRMNEALAAVVGTQKPPIFRDSPENILVQMEKSYAKLVVTLAECGCPDPDALSVYDQYTWIESLEDKYEAQRNALNNRTDVIKKNSKSGNKG